MDRMDGGGIREYQELERFTASSADVAPKEQIDLMARCWFALTAGRTEPIEHRYQDARTGLTETARITGDSELGIATLHDQDLLIFAVSQCVEAQRLGLKSSRRIHFTPYQFLTWMNRSPGGGQYQRLKDALQRLKTTSIQTTIRSEAGKRMRSRVRQFSWISEWETTEENGEIRGVELVLAEWLFESVENFHVLTLDKRYFDIPGSVERWLYLYARKATGGAAGVWRENFKSLYLKSASQQEYKHYASALRRLIIRNDLPGLRLEKVKSAQGKDMLLMERLEKRQPPERRPAPAEIKQLPLIEMTPLEEAWENVLEMMARHYGAPTANAWLKVLRPLGVEAGTLTCRAPSKFIADTVMSQYRHRLLECWTAAGHGPAILDLEIQV